MLDISLGAEDRMFLGSWWNMECGVVVAGARTLGADRSMALDMLGGSAALGIESDAVGFLGSQLGCECESLAAILLLLLLGLILLLTVAAGCTEGGVLDFSFAPLMLVRL